MAYYRIYLLNKDGRIVACVLEVERSDDSSAIDAALRAVSEGDLEIWQEARMVARVGPASGAAGRLTCKEGGLDLPSLDSPSAIFVEENGDGPGGETAEGRKVSPLTPTHLTAARKLLGWSRDRLAGKIGSSHTTVARFETKGIATTNFDTGRVREVLEAAGVEFIGGDGEAGVRMKKATGADAIERR